ncbi:MAG: transcription elongation factor GreA [Deltaproteobacteria bacterium]|nr:transcription elongation factor GreA [Deltaproteobacteria bacterium]
MSSPIPITKAGLEHLKEELKNLLTVERPFVKKEIAEARAHGDLKENAEYHAAREKQGFIEGRIQEINSKLPQFQVVEPGKMKTDAVAFGATVTIANLETEENITYQIVGPDEADLKTNRISFQTPLAQALIGKREGDAVTVNIPRGRMEVEIVSVEYI